MIKAIKVDAVKEYNIPMILRDGSEFTLKLRDGFTMSNKDVDELMKFAVDLSNSTGKKYTEAGVEKLLSEDEIEALPDQERIDYINKIQSATEGEIVTEALINRKMIIKAYDVTEDWLYENTNPEVLKEIASYLQEWMGIGKKKS